MIIDFQQSALNVGSLDSPFWQFGTPPAATAKSQGVGGPVVDIQTVTGNAGAGASVAGSTESLSS